MSTDTTIVEYTVRQTTETERKAKMPYVTSSMVEAVQTCPRWGIIRNVQRKVFVTGYRAMALEAGSAMHDVFAALNFWVLGKIQGHRDHMQHHAALLFTKDRRDVIDFLAAVDNDDDLAALNRLVLNTLGTSGFYDDPSDDRRTLANLEHCASVLVDTFLRTNARFPIFVQDVGDPTQRVGIEQSLDVVFEIIHDDGTATNLRFIGLADTVYHNRDTNIVKLGEYKTAASMNDAWQEAFKTRHQLTAYNGALEAYFDNVSFETILTGSALPVPKTKAATMHLTVDRARESVFDFLNSGLFAMELINRYDNENVLNAPMFTHSCNRYFRPCAFIDLCAAHPTDQLAMYQQLQDDDDLSPSEMKALLQNA